MTVNVQSNLIKLILSKKVCTTHGDTWALMHTCRIRSLDVVSTPSVLTATFPKVFPPRQTWIPDSEVSCVVFCEYCVGFFLLVASPVFLFFTLPQFQLFSLLFFLFLCCTIDSCLLLFPAVLIFSNGWSNAFPLYLQSNV